MDKWGTAGLAAVGGLMFVGLFAAAMLGFGFAPTAVGPEACPFGAARTYTGGWMCLTEADRDFAAETCYTGEGCETPEEHGTHSGSRCPLAGEGR